MYIIKQPDLITFAYKQNKQVAKQLGMSAEHLCGILKGKHSTKYTTAYCIVKLYDSNKEVLDFFDKKD